MDSKTGLIRKAKLMQPFRDPLFGHSLPNGAIVDILMIIPASPDIEYDTAMAVVGWGRLNTRVPLEILEEL